MARDVDWNVDEIDFRDYDLRQLPDSPICPILVKLFLQVPRLTIIPPAFFEHMPVLEVLDLSNTNILSLPTSISSLRLLQEFFLRDCSALMDLPPQVGMLSKLKLFDGEGTELMFIPKEMGELKDLEVLRVSLSQYAKDYIKTKGVNETVIPKYMISELKQLKELCISVPPEAEWWEEEVKDIQTELCNLENLQTLRWYLPTDEVLHQFLRLERNHSPIYANLSNFVLTIGQHVQLTTCLPRDLERKFGELKKCLKWINAEGSMDDVYSIMASTEALFLSRHWTIEAFSGFNVSKLKYCLIAECDEMETLVEASGLEKVETRVKNVEKVGFALLQYLSIHHMKKLKSIWKGTIGKDSLSKLTILALHTCTQLTSIFTPTIAQNLPCLTELTIEDCPKLRSLISNGSHDVKCGPTFPSLEMIFLLDLPELVNIFGGQIMLEKLRSLLVYNCLKLRLSIKELPHIKKIEGENEWWNDLDCDKTPWENIFVPLKKKRDLVEQLFEATNSLEHFHNASSQEISNMEYGTVTRLDELATPSYLVVALAIDGSKEAEYVVRWALDKFVSQGLLLFKLFFIRPKITTVPILGSSISISHLREDVVIAHRKEVERETYEKLLPFKNMCATRKVEVEIVQIESDDVVEAIKQEIVKNKINKLVIGASSKGKFRREHLSSRISKSIPSFCTVYVISKGILSSLKATDSKSMGSSNSTDSSSITDSSSLAPSSRPETEEDEPFEDDIKILFGLGGKETEEDEPFEDDIKILFGHGGKVYDKKKSSNLTNLRDTEIPKITTETSMEKGRGIFLPPEGDYRFSDSEKDLLEGMANSSTSYEQNFSTNLLSLDVFKQKQSLILLRELTRTREETRVSLCTPRLLIKLRQCMLSKDIAIQTNAVAALLNLSLEKTNKLKIVRWGMVPPLIDILKAGSSACQEHATDALFSLSLEDENKTAIGVLGALQPLLHALHSDSEQTRQNSALALYHLSLVQSNRVRLVKLGAVSTLLTLLETGLAGRVLLVLCNLAASSQGKSALLDSNAIECLLQKWTESVDEPTRENCVACLYSLSVGSMRFKGLARAARATEVLRIVEETGSERAREKAKLMLMMLRERDEEEEGRGSEALLEGGVSQIRYLGNSTGF